MLDKTLDNLDNYRRNICAELGMFYILIYFKKLRC